MNQQKPFRVEVMVNAPRDVVWRAITQPAQLRRWFGWEHPGLDGEIEFIFVDNATARAPERLALLGGQAFELEADGPRTIVRVTCAGSLDTAHWNDLYDAMEEGWRTFLYQLRWYLEREPASERRTLFLDGTAPASQVARALEEAAPGTRWYESRYQLAIAVDGGAAGAADGQPALAGLVADRPLHTDEPARVTLTLTTHEMDGAAMAALRARWVPWWSSLVADAKVTPEG